MKKIYFLHKHPTKLGEIITYQGLEVEVTQTLIDNNPDAFKIIDEREELLDKARRDYPIGTVFMGLFGKTHTVKNNPCYSLGAYGSILIDGIYVYRDGRWAEVLPIKFTTEDGVDIYEDMKTYLVLPRDRSSDIGFSHHSWDGDSNIHSHKYFYYKKNALAYIEKHREKTLEDYENILFERGNSMVFSSDSMYFNVYGWLKDNEPKLYYTKILQLIANDLNDGWEPDFNNERQKKYFIDTLGVKVHCSVNYGLVYFKSMCLAQKARAILWNKIQYLFNMD